MATVRQRKSGAATMAAVWILHPIPAVGKRHLDAEYQAGQSSVYRLQWCCHSPTEGFWAREEAIERTGTPDQTSRLEY